MSASKSSPAARGERGLYRRRDSALSSLPESEPQRRQSLAARSDSQGMYCICFFTLAPSTRSYGQVTMPYLLSERLGACPLMQGLVATGASYAPKTLFTGHYHTNYIQCSLQYYVS